MPRRLAGFTLIEVLLAIVIAGTAMAAAAASLQYGVRLWRQMERTARLHQQVRAAFGFLSRDLRHAVPFPGQPFIGSHEEVAFVTQRPGGGLSRVTYGPGVRDGVKVFQRTVLDLGGLPAPPREQPLSIWPAEAVFSFPAREPSAPWSGSWSGKNLPSGVALRVTLQVPGGEAEPFEKILDVPLGGENE